jgi:hypothetical protein
MSAAAWRLAAAVGAALTIVGVFLEALLDESYWDVDGSLAWLGLVLAVAALLLVASSFASLRTDAWLFAVGAVLVGYWAWLPALAAFDSWDQSGAGMWLCLGGALLIAVASAVVLVTSGDARTTPPGVSLATAVTGVGIALVFPGIFLDAEQTTGAPGWSYWDPPVYGHGVGILMLVLAAASAVVFVATTLGGQTHGLDVALTLVLLGLVAFDPVWTAFNDLGDLEVGAWLALAGGILAAGGTWSARAGEPTRAAAEAPA